MQTTYGGRLKAAREHAGLSQAELARRQGLKPQAVQYLEDKNNGARGSDYTAGFARDCGVDPVWLQSGAGVMLTKDQAREPAAAYELEKPAAIAAALRELRPELRRAVLQIVQAIRPEHRREFPLAPAEASSMPPSSRRRSARRIA